MATVIVNPWECIVCCLEFNYSDRRPRNLPCSHHLCTKCIDNLLRKSVPHCPVCRLYVHGCSSSSDFNVNYGVEDFMRFTSCTKESDEDGTARNDMRIIAKNHYPFAKDRPMTDKMKDIAKEYNDITIKLLEEVKSREDLLEIKMKEIKALQEDLDIGITKLEYELKTKIQELVDENRGVIEDLDKESKQLQMLVTDGESKTNELALISEALQNVKSSMSAASCLGKADVLLYDVENWMQNHNLPTVCEDKLKNASRLCKSTKEKTFLMIEVLSSSSLDDNIPSLETSLYRKDNLPEVLTVQHILELNEQLRLLINRGDLYAVQRVRGRSNCAKFSIRGRYLYLHHLQNESPPPNSRTIMYKEVAGLIEKSSVLTFLELGSRENTLGRVHIRLLPNLPRAKNFALLCTGMKEATYANSRLLEVWGRNQRKEYLKAGDYERNTGDGGSPLVPISVQKEKKGDPWKAGCLWGSRDEKLASQFYISTSDNPDDVISSFFGRVEEGLNLIKEAIDSYPDIRQINIINCGLVLNCNAQGQDLWT